MVYKTNQICFSRFWNPDQTVWFDRVNWKPPIKEVLLTLITGYYKKFCEPWEPPFNLLGLTVLTAHTVWVFFFFGYLQPLLLKLQAFNFNHPLWDYQTWDCTPSLFFTSSSMSRSLSLSLSLSTILQMPCICIFASGVFFFFSSL